MTMKDRVVYVASMITAVIAIFLITTVTYWYAWPYKTIVFKDTILPVVDKQVYPGENLRLKMNFTKYTNLPATAVRSFVNDIVYAMPPLIIYRDIGTYNFEGSSIRIPSNLPPGIYKVRHSYSYEVNPIRTITVVIYTEPFEVLSNGSEKKK